MNKGHFVYLLLTERATLYCGYTDNLEKRFQAHIEGKGAKYTKANKPIRIVFQKEFKLMDSIKLSFLMFILLNNSNFILILIFN